MERERVLTLRELNRATLARQLLLGRRRLGAVAAVERVAGMQAQWAPAPYVGLWTRVEGFRRDALRSLSGLAHAPETGLWKPPRTTRYVLIEAEAAEVQVARARLVRRYLAAFGPATRADAAEWSGLRVREVEPALAALEPLRRFRDERGRELLDLARAPRPSADAPAPVRLLPRFDNLVLAHKDRTRVLPEEYRGAVIEGGMVYSAFLVDGFVAGLWRLDRGRVLVEPFAPLTRTARREVEDEAARLEAWLC